ncbi:MBL fold metallo-hydrolase [Streptomyces sp. CA-100214]
MSPQTQLPSEMTWWQRPFPDANTLLLNGRHPAVIDSGFTGHAEQTAAFIRTHTDALALVVNTHWHSDHVGGNALLQRRGAAIAAGTPEAEAIARRDPGCCAAEYLDQPVPPYTVDLPLGDGQPLLLGDTDWEVIRTPGHTPGHLALWQPEERLLVVGDALSDYDVGWVNLALDGPDAATTALRSLKRLADLTPRVILPSHGPIPTDPEATLAAALRRAQRLVDDPHGAVWYGARRILAFALMIRDGIPADEIESYLQARAWMTDAARLLDLTPQALADELVRTMVASGAVVRREGRLHATAPHTPVAAGSLRVPYPRAWPTAPSAGTVQGH